MFIKLNDLRYLPYIFPMVENQLLKYSEAMSDIMIYVLTTLNSTCYVEPSANASKISSTINCTKKWKRSCKHVIFHKYNYTAFQSDNCVFFIYILYTFLPLECAPLELYYIRQAHVYTHYISTERHGVQTEFTSRTHRFRPRHRQGSNLRLIYKRAQQLKDDRESSNDRLERFIQQRVIQHWTPPTHPSFNLFDARLKSFDTWTRKEVVPSPESLAEAGFFFRGTYTSL